MLKYLSIKNLILIQNIEIYFQKGLCVLTGETGAGKSMILDSLSLITGSRTKSSIKPETKTVGIGSQILKELGLTEIKLLATPVKYPSLSGFDLEVTGFEQ